jgi:lysophospholipase L1-like esterase
MKQSKRILPLLLLLSAQLTLLSAQDLLPARVLPQAPVAAVDTLRPHRFRRSLKVVEPQVTLPEKFTEVKANVLTDSVGILTPFFEQLRLLALGVRKDTLHIVHIGDSHVRGHIFPQTTGAGLAHLFHRVTYTDIGINGAFVQTFTRPERISAIARLRPDLLILSFGTNESHNRRYNARQHRQHLVELVNQLREALPGVPMLMTTPPGSYLRGGRRRRRTYTVNSMTAMTTQTILRFADEYGLAVWDIYDILGDGRRAARNWWEAGMMRPDHIHFTPEGYDLQGRLFFQAFIKAYNDYVDN